MTTLVVNLFAGPGAGKSTTAAGTFYHLKQRGLNVEIAHEFAKDLTWEGRHRALKFQPYVMAKQIWRVQRLLGEVDAVITDSPILLSRVYQGEGYTQAFEDYIEDTFKSWRTLNVLLQRGDRAYNPAGRNQTEETARQLDEQIQKMLDQLGVPYVTLSSSVDTAAAILADRVELTLGR